MKRLKTDFNPYKVWETFKGIIKKPKPKWTFTRKLNYNDPISKYIDQKKVFQTKNLGLYHDIDRNTSFKHDPFLCIHVPFIGYVIIRWGYYFLPCKNNLMINACCWNTMINLLQEGKFSKESVFNEFNEFGWVTVTNKGIICSIKDCLELK